MLSGQQNLSPVTPDGGTSDSQERTPEQYYFSALSKHLKRRYTLLWQRKVQLLLVTGDEAAIEQLVPVCRKTSGLKVTVPF